MDIFDGLTIHDADFELEFGEEVDEDDILGDAKSQGNKHDETTNDHQPHKAFRHGEHVEDFVHVSLAVEGGLDEANLFSFTFAFLGVGIGGFALKHDLDQLFVSPFISHEDGYVVDQS